MITLKADGKTVSTEGKIIEVPLYETEEGQYEAHDKLMSEMEANLTDMHNKVNSLYSAKLELDKILKDIDDASLKAEGKKLSEQLDAWDKDMIQRKSQAYDDVENFPNKFTAEYLFLINATNSSIPRVNQSSIDRKKELDQEWQALDSRAETLMKTSIPEYNIKLWEAGIGAIRL